MTGIAPGRDCLKRGVIPEWNAANPVSQRLALRLGYRLAGTVTILRLAD